MSVGDKLTYKCGLLDIIWGPYKYGSVGRNLCSTVKYFQSHPYGHFGCNFLKHKTHICTRSSSLCFQKQYLYWILQCLCRKIQELHVSSQETFLVIEQPLIYISTTFKYVVMSLFVTRSTIAYGMNNEISILCVAGSLCIAFAFNKRQLQRRLGCHSQFYTWSLWKKKKIKQPNFLLCSQGEFITKSEKIILLWISQCK